MVEVIGVVFLVYIVIVFVVLGEVVYVVEYYVVVIECDYFELLGDIVGLDLVLVWCY